MEVELRWGRLLLGLAFLLALTISLSDALAVTWTPPGHVVRNRAQAIWDAGDALSNVAEFVVGFRDVPADYWACEEIMACLLAGIVFGYPDGYYRPGWDVARDQMAVFISRAVAAPIGEAGLADYVPPATPTFNDVGLDYWAYKHIEYAADPDRGIVEGYEVGGGRLYKPGDEISRDQIAVYIARASGWVELDDDMTAVPEAFPHEPSGFWAGAAIEACVENNVIQGYPDGFYRPTWTVSRDQMAVFIARAFALPSWDPG